MSEHFADVEFRCRHCGQVKISPQLLEILERLRTIVGRPLVIVSGYRCEVHNQAVGGTRRSRHMVGDAADLRRGYATLDQARRAGARGIGTRGQWATHVDARPGPRTEWSYGG